MVEQVDEQIRDLIKLREKLMEIARAIEIISENDANALYNHLCANIHDWMSNIKAAHNTKLRIPLIERDGLSVYAVFDFWNNTFEIDVRPEDFLILSLMFRNIAPMWGTAYIKTVIFFRYLPKIIEALSKHLERYNEDLAKLVALVKAIKVDEEEVKLLARIIANQFPTKN